MSEERHTQPPATNGSLLANHNGGSHHFDSTPILEAPRHQYAKAILGTDVFDRVAMARVLVVGAGGIGCELLKNLVLVGFGQIDIIDLDTIDLSNLNRQFLFSKAHIGKAKSLVAAATASQFNPLIHIEPHHANIKETDKFGWEYFEQFDVVCNALDNLDARRWVNRMCIMTGVPLVETGTTGFLGQVQPIMRAVSQCYDCTVKTTPKTYPVCTIRSTPSTPIHCIVWAKTWLFPQLFGAEDENEDAELDKALQEGENAEEIANLRKEATEMRSLRSALFSFSGEDQDIIDSLCGSVFNKLFRDDVHRLLSMEDMWRNRTRPEPQDYQSALRDVSSPSSRQANGNTHTLRDQRILSLQESTDMFRHSLLNLSRRASALENKQDTGLAFDKDDQDAMDFIASASNLRSRVYHIPPQTRFQAKEMAGNIIPAIASTNAIVAAAQVVQVLQAIRRNWKQSRYVSLNRSHAASGLVSRSTLFPPNPACGVCQDDYVRATVDVHETTLGQLKESLLCDRDNGGLGYSVEGLELYESSRLLADEDFDDNLPRTLHDLGISHGNLVTCVDEDGIQATVNVYIAHVPHRPNVDFGSPENLPILRKKPVVAKPNESEDEDDDITLVPDEDVNKSLATKRKRPDDDHEGDGKRKAQQDIRSEGKRPRKIGSREDDAIELD